MGQWARQQHLQREARENAAAEAAAEREERERQLQGERFALQQQLAQVQQQLSAQGREAASCQDCHMSLYPGICVPQGEGARPNFQWDGPDVPQNARPWDGPQAPDSLMITGE